MKGQTNKMKPSKRREEIVRLVRENQRISVEDLAATLGASKETVRRDLSGLAEEGLIRKVHGSAVLPERSQENSFHIRMSEGAEQKKVIGKCAAQLFQAGDTLFIDTGTTTLIFAEELAEQTGLTVITNSTAIAKIIGQGRGKNKVFLLGGEYREESSQNVGTFVIEQISRFRADYAVLTVGAISAFGAMDYALEESEVARAMVQNAKSVTVLADASKIGREALFPWSSLTGIDRIITDKQPEDKALLSKFSAAGVELVIAQE